MISKLHLAAAVALIAISQTSIAQTSFSTLCVEDQSTGFHWKDGAWVRTRFISEKFIVEKLDLPESGALPDTTPAQCVGMLPLNDNGFRNGCYNIREFGEDRNPFAGQVCQELWSEEGSELEQVICDGKITSMVFEPNGNFHYAKVHWLVQEKPDGGEKDSLVLSIGKCSTL